MGKTTGFCELVPHLEVIKKKAIYIAHRNQLIDEMVNDLEKKYPGQYVVVYRNLTTVQLMLKTHRSAFYDLLQDHNFQKYLVSIHISRGFKNVSVKNVLEAAKQIEAISSKDPFIQSILEDTMDDQAGMILAAFKGVLKATLDKSGKASKDHEWFVKHPVIQSLFPAIAFKQDPSIKIMVLTLHKAFYGYFDGTKTLSLLNLQKDDGGHIIFLDELDFLENELVKLICHSLEISNPFHIVELFYNAMIYKKMPSEKFLSTRGVHIRPHIEHILEVVKSLRRAGLLFPTITLFTSSLPQKAKWSEQDGERLNPIIFRTLHTISTVPLYVDQTDRSFDFITDHVSSTKKMYSALWFFGRISYACQLIFQLFKAIEKEDPIIYRELMRTCFYGTVYPEQIRLISHSSRVEQPLYTERGTLLENGYSLYEIKHLQQVSDVDEVEVRHYGMHLTPEKILHALARSNFVFGLSATADIPRHVHNFDINWLKQQNINVVELDEEDKLLIQTLTQKKAVGRDNQIHVHYLKGLDFQDDYQKRLEDFIQVLSTHTDFGEEKSQGNYLKDRVRLFFSTLLWMCNNSKNHQAHLIFLNTFAQIKLAFDQFPSPQGDLFRISKMLTSTSLFEAYNIDLRDNVFTVVFYNAKVGHLIRQSQPAQEEFEALFWNGKPVILVTQYQSAGNGINLQYRPDANSTRKQDFTSISLLEAPYYYLGKVDTENSWDDQMAARKESIWYQAKLFFGKAISEKQFRRVLGTLAYSDEWNSLYRLDPGTAKDALFNNMATFIQAVGRIERIWDKMDDDQHVLLSPEVHKQFQAFFCNPMYTNLHQSREVTNSNNLQQISRQIQTQYAQLKKEVRRQKDSTLADQNSICKEKVDVLLSRLSKLRQGNDDQDARDIGQRLRKSVLKQDFRGVLLRQYNCIAASPYYDSGVLYLTPDMDCIPASLDHTGIYRWRMDFVYDVIRLNSAIYDHFKQRGFELSFDHMNSEFFTPYCYQAILMGAIGEEAITALLENAEISLEEIEDALFEVADLKIKDFPWFLDCKYYSDRTMERFQLTSADKAWRPKLNNDDFRQSACHKYQSIVKIHGSASKMIYINLASSYERSVDYYNAKFEPLENENFAAASIIVVQSALKKDETASLQDAFEQFCFELKQEMMK